jgi:tetratricopeptide (TPR) repeat protein
MESIAHEDLPPEALFARAMILAPDRPGDAVDLLLMLAERNPAHARAPDAFWEASVLLQDLDRARAADVLERLVQACPHDDRVASALRSAIAWTPADAAPARLRRLMLAIDRAPDDPHIDAWRVQAAVLSPPSAAWPLLEAVPLGSDWALPAAQHAVEIVAEETSPEPLARALALAERASHAAAASLRARLVFARLAIIDPSAEHVQQTLELASRLDATRPDQRLLLAKSLLAAGKRREALEHLDALTTLEPQRTDHWWESWTLLLEVALDGATPVDAAAAHAHLFRLSLIDPDLGGSPWQERLQALRVAAPGYTGKP